MTSLPNHQYVIRYGLWHAPCHASEQLAGCEWADKLCNTIPPIVVTPQCMVQSISTSTMQVDWSLANLRGWLANDCPVKDVIAPESACFQTSCATYLNNCLSAVEQPPGPGDVVQVRYRPQFSTLASGEHCCNLVATDVRICSRRSDG